MRPCALLRDTDFKPTESRLNRKAAIMPINHHEIERQWLVVSGKWQVKSRVQGLEQIQNSRFKRKAAIIPSNQHEIIEEPLTRLEACE